jgi:hypothetical protein
MTKYEIYTLVIMGLGYVTGLITIWVKMNIELATVRVEMTTLRAEFIEHKNQNDRDIQNFIEENRQDHRDLTAYVVQITKSMSEMNMKITELVTIQKQTEKNEKISVRKRS